MNNALLLFYSLRPRCQSMNFKVSASSDDHTLIALVQTPLWSSFMVHLLYGPSPLWSISPNESLFTDFTFMTELMSEL